MAFFISTIDFSDGTSDYKNARRMVNGRDHAQDIADIAIKFEKVLSAANPADGATAVPPIRISPLP
jgi:hypothetical protein